jgi:cytidine deaminase
VIRPSWFSARTRQFAALRIPNFVLRPAKVYNGAHLSTSCTDLIMRKTNLPASVRARLLRSARMAMKNAYAPYSNFRVGAAILTSTGDVFLGCNVENASYGMTNCAERTAIFAAVAAMGPKLEIQAVAVANDHRVPCSPCGACRQVIYEFGPQATVLFQGKKGWKQSAIADLLPEGFRLK